MIKTTLRKHAIPISEQTKALTPGETLLYKFMYPKALTYRSMGELIGSSGSTIHRLVAGRCKLSKLMAERLAKALGTTPEFWLELERKTPNRANPYKRYYTGW